MSEKFFIFTLEKDNELFKFIDDDQKNSFENKHFIKIDDHVLFIHSLDLDSEIKHPKLRDDLKGEITNATSCYVSLHRGSKENVKNSQRQIFPQDKTIFIEEHHNSGFIYEKLIEYVKAKDDEKGRIRNDIKEYFELNKTIRENWGNLNADLKNYIIENNAKINLSSNFILVLAELSPDLFGENFNEEWTEKNPAEFYGVDLICESNLLDHHKHIILLSTVKQEEIEKFNIKASNEFLKIPIIHLFNIDKNTTIEDIGNFGNRKFSEIPFTSHLFIADMKETFCEENGLLDEIIHPLYRELTQEEEEKIYQGIIRNFSLDDKEKEELRKFINERKKESIRELVLRKKQKGKPEIKPENVVDDDTYIKDQKIVVIEDEKQVAEKSIKGKSIERGFKDENFQIITTYEEYEGFIRQPIITESIFIIDYRLKWWPLQGYDIIKEILGKNPTAYIFLLSGKNKSILLKLDPKIGARVQIFSKDDVLNNEAEFNLFARTIYNKIVEISFINRIIEEDPNIKNLTEEKKQEKVQQLKKLLETANFTSIINYVYDNLKKVIESLEKNETPSFEVPEDTWGVNWNENKIKVRLFAMCYYDYLRYNKKPKNSYENLFDEVKKILKPRNEKMINNKLILKEEVFENWDLMLPIETKIRKILLFYYSLKDYNCLFRELFGGENKDIKIILKNFEWLKSLFPELTEEAKTFLKDNLSYILENHAFKIIEEDLETLQGELNKFGEILDDPREVEEKWENLFNESFLKKLCKGKNPDDINVISSKLEQILPQNKYEDIKLILYPIIAEKRKREEVRIDENMPNENEPSPDYELMRESLREKIEEALSSTLDQMEREVVKLHFGIGYEDQLTLEEIGKKLNLEENIVREIIDIALNKLRNAPGIEELKEYLSPTTYLPRIKRKKLD
jgi:hypothetical protein